MASERIGKNEARGFIAAWLGWAFDGLDGFLYTLVAIPFLTQLLAGAPTSEVQEKASWAQGAFLVGWALGGAVFGRIGDRLGRTKTLTLTILTYAVFTGLTFFATSWWDLMIYRFIAALGIGGEWAAGSALVAETFHSRHRAWASATLQSGYMVGMILAALTVGAVGLAEPRYVFLIGVVPAFLTLWIRYAVPEPEEWKATRETQQMPKISELFGERIRATTLKTLVLTSIALTTIWAFLFFSTQVLLAVPAVAALPPAEKGALVRNVVIFYSLWNILGNYVATYLAELIGYRKAFAAALTFSAVSFLVAYRFVGPGGQGTSLTVEQARTWFSVVMFLGAGLFAIFPLYIPKLFPTLLRTTGAGFCYNFGRLIAAIGTVAGGTITAKAGGPVMAIFYAGFLYLPAIIVAFFMPEVPHEEPASSSEPVLTPG